jgi:4-amino-4-deoxy-L-arabinose transferase-like glycosyltransferase
VSERWPAAALAGFVVFVWLGVLPTRPLFNPDEGRYAEIPREMLQSHDWVVPHLDGLAYVEKPPLQYWATAASIGLFGTTAFAARLYTALCALAGIGVVVWLARRLWTPAAALRAGAVLASLTLYAVLGQLLTLDMSLTFYMTLALAGFLAAQPRAGESGGAAAGSPALGPSPAPMLVAWAATAAGVLTKGLIAALIPAAVLVLYTLVTRDRGPWRRLQLRWGLPLFLAMTLPWFVLAARRLPDFLEFFFVHEHFARYLTPIADRDEAWWFFIPVFLLGSLPWTGSALRVLATGWRRGVSSANAFDAPFFLWLWVVFVLGFFSLSDSKLIPYVLPALPALALSIAALPEAAQKRDVRYAAALALALAAALAVAAVGLPHWLRPSARSPYFLQLARPALEVAGVVGVSALFALVRRDREGSLSAVVLSAGWCVGVLLLMRAATAVAPIYSGQSLAAAVPPAMRELPIYSVSNYDQTLPFYLQRTVTLAAYHGELDYGLRHAGPGGAELNSVADFTARWTSGGDALAIMESDMFDQLRARGLPMRELGRDDHRVLVARR